jgi:hypothetical protein
MTDAEKKVVVDTLKLIGEQELPSLVDAEITKIPAAYQPVVAAFWTVAKPMLVTLIDQQIAKL